LDIATAGVLLAGHQSGHNTITELNEKFQRQKEVKTSELGHVKGRH